MEKPKCPSCGSDKDIRYVEDIQNWRRVLGLEDGTLRVEARYHIGEGWDDGYNARYCCGACLHEFPIPDDLEIDWVCEEDGLDEVEDGDESEDENEIDL